MRVAINGALVRAANGNGMRALSMGADGKIAEHARLFGAGGVQGVVTAAAVFQVVSVLVARNHLADINARLSDLHEGITDLSQFPGNQRRARINAAHDYLRQAHVALAGGELSPAIRAEHESCDRDLTEIHRHPAGEYLQRASQAAADTDSFGIEAVTANALRKVEHRHRLGDELALCLRTRALAWHMLSPYPGEPAMNDARRDPIRLTVENVRKLPDAAARGVASDLAGLKSSWNR